MEFNVRDFTDRIRQVLYDNFPYELDSINEKKHKNRPKHIRDVVLMNNPVSYADEKAVFDIGGEYAEMAYPYYHILQDSEVIHIRGKSTKLSRGSQQEVSEKSARDYGIVNWNGKTFTQEYRKNVRGKRSRADKARVVSYQTIGGRTYRIVSNLRSDYYKNVHYRYLDKILDDNVESIAAEFGLIAKRKKITSLEDDYNESLQIQKEDADIMEIMESFMED